jgi:glutamyl-tRNA reductase
MRLFVAGLSYKTAPVELREQVAVSRRALTCNACRLKIAGDLSELVLLSTCNRVEVYGVTPEVNHNIYRLFNQLCSEELNLNPYVYQHESADAVRHLFSVASGLDSMVLGETEITGQVKFAYQNARESKLTGRVLNRVFQTALQTAKEVRTTTDIGRGATSVGSVAAELAEKIFSGDLSERSVMIVGAGKMGEACVRHLTRKGARSVLVSNRSFERAEMLAKEFGGHAIHFDNCVNAMAGADIVVSSTGSHRTVINREDVEMVMRARRNRPLFLIDIAVPRDIDPTVHLLENVYLYNIDNLESLVAANVRLRQQELDRCRAIIDKRTEAVMAKLIPVRKTSYDDRLQSQPGWVFNGAVACHS